MGLFRLSFLTAASMLAFAIPAKADYVVWTDVHTGATVSYPDTWKTVNNQQPDDLITLSLPSGDDHAICRLRADEDKRFMIYPNRFRPDVQKVAFSKEFWKDYTASYDQVNVIREADEAGLGQGYAGMVLISYTTPPGEPLETRAGIIAAANYFDKDYVAECSSTSMSYPKWHQAFLSFFKTVTFKKSIHELKSGDYRSFLKDWGTINVIYPNGVSRSVY